MDLYVNNIKSRNTTMTDDHPIDKLFRDPLTDSCNAGMNPGIVNKVTEAATEWMLKPEEKTPEGRSGMLEGVLINVKIQLGVMVKNPLLFRHDYENKLKEIIDYINEKLEECKQQQ